VRPTYGGIVRTCEDCGCRVYGLGCVNCNEVAYIEEQEMLTDLQYPESGLSPWASEAPSSDSQPGW
jgi:hypothetical protein